MELLWYQALQWFDDIDVYSSVLLLAGGFAAVVIVLYVIALKG